MLADAADVCERLNTCGGYQRLQNRQNTPTCACKHIASFTYASYPRTLCHLSRNVPSQQVWIMHHVEAKITPLTLRSCICSPRGSPRSWAWAAESSLALASLPWLSASAYCGEREWPSCEANCSLQREEERETEKERRERWRKRKKKKGVWGHWSPQETCSVQWLATGVQGRSWWEEGGRQRAHLQWCVLYSCTDSAINHRGLGERRDVREKRDGG